MSSTDSPFFASAASSFYPAPYPSSSDRSVSAHATRNHLRTTDSLAVPPPGMDPQPTDPNVLFIHPPFNSFPSFHQYPEGLTYSLLADNPDWFLDANDFVSQNNANASAIPYPTTLEPPRGWCPAKKKDLKERGTEGWPEGEEPRLRCTFCRRTYAGVNAKSMWRRHVFEKHKIAMANRRDGTDRPRGRGSGKENKQLLANRSREDAHESLISIVVTPQTQLINASHKFRFRAAAAETPRPGCEREGGIKRASTSTSQSELSAHSEDDTEESPPVKTHTPPLTPPHANSSDPVLNESSDIAFGTSPVPNYPAIPDSPYNPLQTPSFRHSPPRLPSDQPWRYPSPSHPLHSRTREMSLIMLLGDSSPLVRAAPTIPSTPLNPQSSPLSMNNSSSSRLVSTKTPIKPKSHHRKPPLSSPQLTYPPSSSPVKQVRRFDNLVDGSPLVRSVRKNSRHKRHSSDISEKWDTGTYLLPSSISLDAVDPFRDTIPWGGIGNVTVSPIKITKPTLDGESPVLRSGPLPLVNLGIGLIEPFDISKDESLFAATDLRAFLSPIGEEKSQEGKRATAPEATSEEDLEHTPTKKRRVSVHGSDL